jgi:hypothetical protein
MHLVPTELLQRPRIRARVHSTATRTRLGQVMPGPPRPGAPLATPYRSKYLVRASYLQIYNEAISDLLKPDRTNLSIREDRRRGVFVDGLSEWVVRSPGEVYGLMTRGAAEVGAGAGGGLMGRWPGRGPLPVQLVRCCRGSCGCTGSKLGMLKHVQHAQASPARWRCLVHWQHLRQVEACAQLGPWAATAASGSLRTAWLMGS